MLTKEIWDDDVFVPATTVPAEGVAVIPLSEWYRVGEPYTPAGAETESGYWTDQVRVVLLVKDQEHGLYIQRKFWHGGWNSGGVWETLEPLF